ncbi:MAG TPA: filamentous hemagglutinin N-terminal domain-containing protein, partial [Steroidobacteraceae bacterium]
MRMPRQQFPEIKAMVFALGAALGWTEVGAKNPALPVPCAAGACGTTGPSQFVTAGKATAVAAANNLTVDQTSSSAVLNWSSFNIGAGGAVTFKQPGASSIALNRIFQASPSQIFGSLKANGQVYLLNLNGFLFGPTATVNVGGLLVSTLPLSLTDATFANGILSPLQQNNTAVFDATLDPLAPGVGRASVLDANGNLVLDANGKPQSVQILVQPGAQLAAADQGRLLLAGQSVTNGGTLTAPDGQVILAAGSKIYLQADRDPGLRGLIVEVDANSSNVAWNQLTGTLSAPRGNVTMVGLAVNQDGRISATTSVAANGSIRLEAAQGAAFGGTVGAQTVSSSQGGTLTIGQHSDMEILPELSSSATAVAAQAQLPSSVTLLGEQVILQGGSIVAPGGNLTAIAAANPSAAAVVPSTSLGITGVTSVLDPNARLRIDAGTDIDLSGSVASLPVTANLVAAQLRSSELADDPTQRNGALHGTTVYVNERLGSPAIADLSGDFAAVPQSIAQRTETGGKVVLQSEGDVVFAKDAHINVSGGSTAYAGGVLQTSYLVGADGKLYPIATANPLLNYVGVLNPTFSQSYNKWGVQDVLPTAGLSSYQPGYVQGAAAGSVQFAAPTMVLQGTLQGSAVNGLYQRTPTTSVSGGQLIIGLPSGASDTLSNLQINYVAPAVRLTPTPTPIVVADDSALPGPLTLDLPVSYLNGSGFTSTQIFSNYGVTLPAATPLALAPGSTLSINAARVDLLSNITDPAGALSFQNINSIGTASTTGPRPGVYVGDDVTLDVRGLYTNDMPTRSGAVATAQTWQNGGSIDLGVMTPGALLALGNDDALRASGGAWVQSSGTLSAGTGGSITLSADAVNAGLDVGANLAIDGFGVNGAAGGSFNLTAPRIAIGTGTGNWIGAQQVDDTLAPGGVLQLSSGLFADYGFQKFALNASGLVVPGAADADVLSVAAGTIIDATVRSLRLDPGATLHSSAATLDGLATVTLLAPYLRPAASVSLEALPTTGANPAANTAQNGATSAGDIGIATGASITTDAGGSINLIGIDSIVVDGALRAPGGTVSLLVQPPFQNFEVGFLPTQRIELGSDGVIDVSGAFVPKPSSLGLDLGRLYGGGSVQLFADRGAVVTDPGSLV